MGNNIKDVIVVMPLFNEAPTIKQTLTLWDETLSKLKLDYIIEIYNDGSTDKSKEEIESLNNNRIKFIDNKHQGFSKMLYKAYKNVENTNYVFHADSDDEIMPIHFEELWERRNDADLIIGKRINRKQKIHRKIATSMASIIINILFGKKIHDANIPFRLLKIELLKEFMETLPAKFLYPNLFLSAYCIRKQKKYIEIPVNFENKKIAKSHLNNLLKLSFHSFLSCVELIIYKLLKL